MATLQSIATGDFTSSTTWALCNATAELDSEAASQGISTTQATTQSFTPGAITVSGIALKLHSRVASPTGTTTINLSTGVPVSGTTVTVNNADFPLNKVAGLGGWVYFEFASPVTLLSATAYTIQVVSSVSSQITLWRNATTSNFSRLLVTTTNQAPAAGDKILIGGALTGAGSNRSIVVTMNNTNTTVFGNSDTVLPSFAVSHLGTLSYGVASSTNYYLKLNAIMYIYPGGTFTMGTVANPIPESSSAVLEFNCASNGQFFFYCADGTMETRWATPATGDNSIKCLLTNNIAVGATTGNVDKDTGWKSGDEIAIAANDTAKNGTRIDELILSADAGVSSLAFNATTYAHDGNTDVKSEICKLNRKIVIRSASSSFTTNLRFGIGAIATFNNTEFRYLGHNATNKQGITFDTTIAGGGNVTFTKCIARNCYQGFYINGTSNISFNDCVAYKSTATGNNGGFHQSIQTHDNTVIIDDCWAMGCGGYGFFLASPSSKVKNIRASSNTSGIYYLNNSTYLPSGSSGEFDNWYARTNTSFGLILLVTTPVTISNITTRRNGLYGVQLSAANLLTIETLTAIGNGNSGMILGATSFTKDIKIINGIFNGETSYTTSWGINVGANSAEDITFINCEFGNTGSGYLTHSSGEMTLPAPLLNGYLNFKNCTFGSTVFASGQANISRFSAITSENHQQTANNKLLLRGTGTISSDTVIYDSSSPSIRLAPSNASANLEYVFLRAPVASGQTATVKIKVRESVSGDGTDYNGDRIKLYVRRNDLAGITSDTLLATATISSEGSFEELTGVTATVDQNCVLEFYVVCNGTTGWVNIDDVTPPTAVDTTGFKYTDDTVPFSTVGNNSAGGGGGSSSSYYIGGI